MNGFVLILEKWECGSNGPIKKKPTSQKLEQI